MEHVTASRSAGFVGVGSAAVLGLIPKLTCPLCWPAYTAALGALGVGFVDYTPYLAPVMGGFVVTAIAALALTSRRRQSALPLIAGAIAGALLMFGKFALDSDAITYGAAALLVAAPFLPGRRSRRTACPNSFPKSLRRGSDGQKED